MNFLRNVYRKIFSPIYRTIEAEVGAERKKCETEMGVLREEIVNIHNSIQYFADTLAEKSYLIQCNSDELKREMYELKKQDIRIQTLMQKVSAGRKSVYQVVPVFRRGDAIGDYALFINDVLQRMGITTAIYTYQNLSGEERIKSVEELKANASDVIMLHMAAENDFAEVMEAYAAKKVLYYHNITPSEFFHNFDEMAEQSTKNGRRQVERLVSVVDCCVTDSEYNKADLKQMGYVCPIHVLNIPFEKKKFENVENLELKSKIKDGKTNLIFVGRIAPNKKIEDVIRCYQKYKDSYDANARLILVGSYDKEGKYYQYLQDQIRDTDDIIMTGHVDTQEWITYYKYADVFVCMSEHEGYCVPLIEAMSFEIPIVAFSSSAVPGTLGSGGILIDEKNMEIFAEAIHKVVTSAEIREAIQQRQMQELQKYNVDKIESELNVCITKIMEE